MKSEERNGVFEHSIMVDMQGAVTYHPTRRVPRGSVPATSMISLSMK